MRKIYSREVLSIKLCTDTHLYIIHFLTASSSGSADPGPKRPAATSEAEFAGRL